MVAIGAADWDLFPESEAAPCSAEGVESAFELGLSSPVTGCDASFFASVEDFEVPPDASEWSVDDSPAESER
jgi:hypothetical protein